MNCGNSCAEIFRMFEGYYGPYYTPTVDEDGNLSWTNNAGLPNPPAISIKGDPGTGLEISGLVATEADLPATAEDWTCYLVGTEIPYTVYTYNPNNGWMSLGELASGPKGDPGAVYTPSVSPEGLLSWTNDGGLPNPEPVNIKGPAYTLTEEDKAAIVADVVDEIPLVDPDAKTAAMTQGVGVDENGKLWTAPSGGGGTSNYNELSNKPAIGGVTLEGDKTPAQLGLVAAQQGAGLIPDTERQQIQDNADDIADLQGEQRQQGSDLQQLQTDVDAIEEKIPSQASAQNQLADKDFVNSSINSSTAFFRGSFASRAALLAVAWQTTNPAGANYVSNNDYAYVQDDESQNDEAWRYIYVLETGGQNNGWRPQFRVNESPLTAAQVAALNSGATAALIAQITANQTAIAGKYTKPAAGIPASDLAAGVIPTVPTNVSAFTNDAGYLTLATLPIYNGEVGT